LSSNRKGERSIVSQCCGTSMSTNKEEGEVKTPTTIIMICDECGEPTSPTVKNEEDI